ncbi:MAG: heparan-alpha-glucosaminide N-acetyltransferase domain-containing protein, partial [Myxococcota bacterium]
MEAAGQGTRKAGGRVAGVDVARAVASLVMIQGHAYHGWVATEHRDAAYAFTRVLGTLPLPAFLVLAGAGMTMRLEAGARRGERAGELRRGLLRRGLQVLGYGYAVNLAYGLIDGGLDAATLLRTDVLHVIGLSIAAAAAFAVRAAEDGSPDVARFGRRALGLGLLVTLACPFVSAGNVPPLLAPWVGLVVDAPPYTRMPLVPLLAWLGVGAGVTAALRARRDAGAFSAIAGAPAPALALTAALGALAAL